MTQYETMNRKKVSNATSLATESEEECIKPPIPDNNPICKYKKLFSILNYMIIFLLAAFAKKTDNVRRAPSPESIVDNPINAGFERTKPSAAILKLKQNLNSK